MKEKVIENKTLFLFVLNVLSHLNSQTIFFVVIFDVIS